MIKLPQKTYGPSYGSTYKNKQLESLIAACRPVFRLGATCPVVFFRAFTRCATRSCICWFWTTRSLRLYCFCFCLSTFLQYREVRYLHFHFYKFCFTYIDGERKEWCIYSLQSLPLEEHAALDSTFKIFPLLSDWILQQSSNICFNFSRPRCTLERIEG